MADFEQGVNDSDASEGHQNQRSGPRLKPQTKSRQTVNSHQPSPNEMSAKRKPASEPNPNEKPENAKSAQPTITWSLKAVEHALQKLRTHKPESSNELNRSAAVSRRATSRSTYDKRIHPGQAATDPARPDHGRARYRNVYCPAAPTGLYLVFNHSSAACAPKRSCRSR